jgi:hypothetical protein
VFVKNNIKLGAKGTMLIFNWFHEFIRILHD